MTTMKKQRGVSLNADVYAQIEQAAERAGETATGYLVRAAEQRIRRDGAAAYAALIARPEVAQELAAHRAYTQPYRDARDARLAGQADAA